MHTQSLDGDQWTVRAVGDLAAVPEHIRGRVFPARVPGCVHLDLIRAGVLRHPNLGYAEREQEWIGRTDWRYELDFTADPARTAPGPATLRFECLDAIATVELNGVEIGTAANFHTEHAFAAGRALKPGGNVLAVTLAAPVPFVEREHARLGRLPHNGDELGWRPFNMIRKPACNFGWDWGPRVPTSGVVGSVELVDGRLAQPAVASPTVRRMRDGKWRVEWANSIRGALGAVEDVELRRAADGAHAEVERVNSADGDRRGNMVLVPNPELWWPRGYGRQSLYDILATVRIGDRRLTYGWRIGFRTINLDTSGDTTGTGFTFRVNDLPIFCRGANWIPDTLFPPESTPDRIRERLNQVVDANMNMIRVWGGGLYEQRAFYEACDELGLMVWQDFMFACAIYPDGALGPSIFSEFACQINRLAPHPCLVLWCGGNECVEGFQHWGWKQRLAPGDPLGRAAWGWGTATYGLVLPTSLDGVVEMSDPSRPYWPNSPWSGRGQNRRTTDLQADTAWDSGMRDVRDPDHGDRHTWDLHFEDVRQIVPRFVSEFGRIAPACERTLHEAELFAEVFGDAAPGAWPREAPRWSDATRAALEHRLRQTGGSKVAYDPVLPEHFRCVAPDLRGWLWQTQILQCRALTTHIEWLRANAPRCMGALLWQLNDCWACQSWSIIDSAGRPKPAWYAVRRAFEPRLLTIQPLGHGADPAPNQGRSGPPAEALSIVLINDTDEPAGAPCRVRRVTFGGLVLAARELPLGAAPRTNATLPDLAALVGEPDDPSAELLVAEWGAHRACWFWERDLRLHLPDDPLSAECIRGADGLTVRLRARALAKDIIIAADLLGEHARADDNSFTLLPGETREVRIAGVAACALPVPEFVRCASGPATPA